MASSNGIVSRQEFRLLRERLAFWRAESRRDTFVQAGLFAVAVLIGAVFAFPFYWLIKIAITWPSTGLFGGTPTLGIENPSLFNFINLIFMSDFQQFFMNNVIIVTMIVAASLVFNSLAAYALTLDFHGRRAMLLFFVANMMIPAQTVVIPVFLVSKELGLLNSYLGMVLPLSTIIINIFVLYNSFAAIPDSIVESARLDGASELYILFGVYWPLSKAALATNVILAFVFGWNSYIWPLLIASQRRLQTLSLALADFQGTNQGSYALLYAFTLLAVIPIVLLFLLLQRQFIESAVMGSIKE